MPNNPQNAPDGPETRAMDTLTLEPGEAHFVRYLRERLPTPWEIFIQPPLNGKRPDVIVLNPHVGLMIFEVKNWNLDRYYVDVDQERIRIRGQQEHVTADNPFHQASMYRNQITDVLAPSLGLKIDENPRAFGCVRIGLIFPHEGATTARATALMHPLLSPKEREHVVIIGRDTLDDRKTPLSKVLPDVARTHSQYFEPAMAAELRRWIGEPEAEYEQRQPLQLTSRQTQLAQTRTTTGYRRVRGGAGSGKSQALAARAGHLALEGRDVLVCSFNITMFGYLSDLARRYRPRSGAPSARQAVKQHVHFSWFHRFCKDEIIKHCGPEVFAKLFADTQKNPEKLRDVLENRMPRLLGQIALERAAALDRYDAILVDEGQDWNLHWWDVLRRYLKEDGEMLLVSDRTQDLYGRTGAWTEEAMTGAGFRGEWFTLDDNHRLPPSMIPMLRDFATRYAIPEAHVPLVDTRQTELHAPSLFWMNLPENQLHECAFEVIEALPQIMPGSEACYPDITILMQDHHAGLQLLEANPNRGVDIGHVFGRNHRERQLQKRAFRQGMGKLKASTVHSFKGLEDRVIIIVVDRFAAGQRGAQWLYTAMTRVRNSDQGACLVVLSCADELRAFGERWFQSLMRDELRNLPRRKPQLLCSPGPAPG